MNIYDYQDYRLFLIHLVEATAFTQAELARSMNCQAAYLSQVLKHKAELTEDHGIKLCSFLGFSENETEYFLVILRLARAGTPALANYLEKKRLMLSELQLEVEGRINVTKSKTNHELNLYYCSSWIPAALHSGVSCNQYQTASSLSKRFNLSLDMVEYHLKCLEKFYLVKHEKTRWIFAGGSIHFPKNSAMDALFQTNRRMHAVNSLNDRKKDDLHYASVFSIDAKGAKRFRLFLVDAIEKFHKEAEPAASEEVYSICIDFFQA